MSAYCGIGELPKGKHRGTFQECLKSNQVRYWGVKRVRRTKLERELRTKELEAELDKHQLKINKMVWRSRRIKELIEGHAQQAVSQRRDKAARKRNRDAIAKLEKELTSIRDKVPAMKDKKETLEQELRALIG